MFKSFRKLTLFALVIVMVAASVVVPEGIKAEAATYTTSSLYNGSQYHNALKNVTLTSDPATNIVNVAKSQVGYMEGNSSSQLAGTVAGSKNYTEYGLWYANQVGNDVYKTGAWCASFVSWCANVAGISTSVIPLHAYTEDGRNFYEARNRSYSWDLVKAGVYTPKKGDIVYFYNDTAGRTVTHVGIVEKFQNNILYTIEGNTQADAFSVDGGCCATHTYDLNSKYPVYICSPDYSNNIDAPNGYYQSTGDYTVTASSLNVRAQASIASGIESVGSLSQGATFKCLQVVNDPNEANRRWAKISHNGQTGYVSLGSSYVAPISAVSASVYSVSLDKSSYASKAPITVTAKGTKGTDWVGVFKSNETPSSSNAIYKANLSGFSSGKVIINGGAGSTAGTRADQASFANGLPAGNYKVALLNKAGTVLSTASFSVSGGSSSVTAPTPVWAWNFGEQGFNQMPANSVVNKGSYVTVTTIGGDSQLYPVDNGTYELSTPINTSSAKFLVIKLRFTANNTKQNVLEIYCGAQSGTSFSYIPVTVSAGSGWQYIVVDCVNSCSTANASFQPWSGTRKWFRIDPSQTTGAVCDVDWVAFFSTADQASQYVYAEQNGIVTGPAVSTQQQATAKPSSGTSSNTTGSTTTGNPTGSVTSNPTGDVTGVPEENSTNAPENGATNAPNGGESSSNGGDATADTNGDDSGSTDSTQDAENTTPPMNDDDKTGGCGSVIVSGAGVVAVALAAVVLAKKKED